jgi:fatty-acyl-CoA synthase
MPFRASIAAALERVADLFPADVAITQGDRTLTWGEFDDQAARVASFLASCGVGQGDRVALGCRNCPGYLVAWLAALKLGATPINVNYRYQLEELIHLITDSRAKVLVHDDALAGLVAQVCEVIPGLALVSVDTSSDPRCTSVALAAALRADPLPRVVVDGELEWRLYTGGTTGRPKAVVLTQRYVIDKIGAQALQALGAPAPSSAADDPRTMLVARHGECLVVLTASPLMHGTGIYGALTALLSGGTIVLLGGRRFDPVETASTVGRRQVTDLHIVGDAFALPLVEALDAASAAGNPFDLSSLRRIQSAGTVWSGSVKQRILSHADVVLVDLIGATEGGPFAIGLATRETDPAELSGFRLPPGSRLLDDDDRDVVSGSETVGVLAAPAADGAHYAGDAARSANVFRTVDGVLYAAPGDLAQMNADGSLRLLGRGSSVINTGGEKVFAAEIENTLRSHPEVLDAVVVGIPDPQWGALVGAVVAARLGHRPDPGALGDHVARTLAGYKRPRLLAVVSELQRTTIGKPDLGWARELLASTSGS